MTCRLTLCFGFALLIAALSWGQSADQSGALHFPATVEAGNEFSVPTTGSGQATLYVVGPASALRRTVRLGESIRFAADDLTNAGHYSAFLAGDTPTQVAQFDIIPSRRGGSLSFLARPSRLPVNLASGLSGVAYVFDVFRNLVLQPEQVSFELSDSTGHTQSHVATSHNGVAWVKMNSAAKAGAAQFQVAVGTPHERRVIQQVPGDPCSIKMSARGSSNKDRVSLETDQLRDCNGNPVPDGTIVTFTETYKGGQSTVDVPLKRGVARTELPAHSGAVLSVASGVVMGNEIRWTGGL